MVLVSQDEHNIESLRNELADVRQQLAEVRHHCSELCADLADAVRMSMDMQRETVLQIQAMQAEFISAVAQKCDALFRLSGDNQTMN